VVMVGKLSILLMKSSRPSPKITQDSRELPGNHLSTDAITSLPMHDSPGYQSSLPKGHAPLRLNLSSTLQD
jgi:hypothetical protein